MRYVMILMVIIFVSQVCCNTPAPLNVVPTTVRPSANDPSQLKKVDYQAMAGDTLDIFVWQHPDMTKDIVIRPDGKFAFPLIGDIEAEGKTLTQIGDDITKKLTDSADYHVMVGDTLDISVWQHPDMTKDVIVRPDGTFAFPLIGDIEAEGKTVTQINDDITKKLTESVDYQLMVGDTLEISVWQHADLTKEAVVMSDGKFSFPLIGDIDAKGKTVTQIDDDITKRLTEPVDYQVIVGDTLEILVWQHADLTRDVVVRPDGKFSFPLIKDIDTEGKTVPQINDDITKKLAEYIVNPQISVAVKKFIVNPQVSVAVKKFIANPQVSVAVKKFIANPQVSVTVKNFAGEKVIVLGEVGKPGVYKFFGTTSFLDIIAEAGGFTKDKGNALIIRGELKEGAKESEVMLVDVNSILNGNLRDNVVLYPRDIIYVSAKPIADVARYLRDYVSPILGNIVSLDVLSSTLRK